MTNNSDPSQPTRSIFGPKADLTPPLPVDAPDSSAARAVAIEFVTSATGPLDAMAGLRARCEVIDAATVAVHAALQVIGNAGAPVPPQLSEVAAAKFENAAAGFERLAARWKAEREERAAAAAQPSVTSALSGHAASAKAPRISRLVRDLAAGKPVTLPGAVGPPFKSADRLCLSARDREIFWLLARYGYIAVSDLAKHFGGSTTTQTLQMRGNKLERAGLIERHDLSGRTVAWVPTRSGLFISGVTRPPAVSFKRADALRTLVAARSGLIYQRWGYRVATRRELLAGRYFEAPEGSQFAGATLDLELVIQLRDGPGLTHCPDLVIRRFPDEECLFAPIGVEVELGDISARAWEAVVEDFHDKRPVQGIIFVTADAACAREIRELIASRGVTRWVKVMSFVAPRYLR